jgi:mannose-6-phosphate isomerase-like protein (cupin superfamily)
MLKAKRRCAMENKNAGCKPRRYRARRVRILLNVAAGTVHFEIGPGETSVAVKHRSVDEIRFFLRRRGQMWRKYRESEEVVDVAANVCLSISAATSFQFRSVA